MDLPVSADLYISEQAIISPAILSSASTGFEFSASRVLLVVKNCIGSHITFEKSETVIQFGKNYIICRG